MNIDLSKALLIGGEIDQEKLAGLGTYLIKNPKKGLMLINSEGGMVTEGFAMYDLIELVDANLTTLAIGQVESIAMLPFLAGTRRLCTKHAVFSFHHGSFEMENPEPQREMVGIIKELMYLDDKYKEIISKKTKLHLAEVKEKMAYGYYFNADEALRLGFVHKIL